MATARTSSQEAKRVRSTVVRIMAALPAAYGLFGGVAHALCAATVGNPATITEYYDSVSGRYFPSWSSQLYPNTCTYRPVTRSAPANAKPTGLSLDARGTAAFEACDAQLYPPPYCTLARSACTFESGDDPPSTFVTIHEGECRALKRPGSGWTYLEDAPALTAWAVDPITRACNSPLTPIYRFVTGGGARPVNHRYVGDPKELEAMRARANWVDEGIAFCVLGAQRHEASSMWWRPYSSFAPQPYSTPCQEVWCLDAVGFTPPSVATVLTTTAAMAPYVARTGALNWVATAITRQAPVPSDHTFVMFLVDRTGFFLTGRDSTGANVLSLRTRSEPLASFPVLASPFFGYDVPMTFEVKVRMFVRTVAAPGPDDHAYIQPYVIFRDRESDRKVTVSAGSIGTVPPGDVTTADAADGSPLVHIALGASPSLGSSLGVPSLQVPKTFQSDAAWGWGGDFIYRMNEHEFREALERARRVDPLLSNEPSRYAIETFGVKGEVVGGAEIGYQLEAMTLSVLRP